MTTNKKLSQNPDGKYHCDMCSYQTTCQGSLYRHKHSIYEGVWYSCDQCQYQATQQSSLTVHKQSVHEGVSLSCDKCEYQDQNKVDYITYTD